MQWDERLEYWRFRSGYYASPTGARYGAFDLPGPCGMSLRVLADDGSESAWEHVSVSGRRIPNWEEMCFIKKLFWSDDETVVQYHPRSSDYVNWHPRTLHLWRPLYLALPTPPTELIGPRAADPPVIVKP